MAEEARVKVTLNQAAEFAAQGFEVECYVLPGKPAAPQKVVRKRSPVIQPNELLTISVQHDGPVNGKSSEVWAALKAAYWTQDVTRQVRCKELRQAIQDMGGDHSLLAAFVNKYGCIRKVG